MGKKLVFASNNNHKIEEVRSMIEPLGFEILSLKDIGFNKDIVEDGATFKENSHIKAKTIFDEYKVPVIADDTGLLVDCLNGEPGVHSHRYSGENASDEENRKKLIRELKKLNLDRYPAHFVTSMTYIDSTREFNVEGELYGEIILEERGSDGFGYDPIFYLRDRGVTVGELNPSEKNEISHRHNALIKLIEELRK